MHRRGQNIWAFLGCFYKQSPHELRVSGGRFQRAERPHVFGSVAELDTGGQLTGQEAQRVKTEDPEEKIMEIKMLFKVNVEASCLTVSGFE